MSLPPEPVATLHGGGCRVPPAPVASWSGNTNRRGDRPGGAGRRHRAVRGAGTPLPRSVRPVRDPHAGLGGRSGGRGAGRVHPRVRAAAAVPRPGQLRGVVLPDPAEPLPRRAAAGRPGGTGDGRGGGAGHGAGRRPPGAGGAAAGAAAGAPVTLPAALEARVMAEVRQRVIAPSARRWWHRLAEPWEIRLRLRPWILGPALAAAAVLVLILARSQPPVPPVAVAAAPESVYVRFVLYAPGAHRVSVAGTFNQWDATTAPLAPAGAAGVWATTVALPVGQHQYAFLVDGRRWVNDPAAPMVDDGFGRRNSVVAVTAGAAGARAL